MSADIIETYRLEAADLLAEIEESALILRSGDVSAQVPDETVNRIFRAVHTLKGSGAMVGLDQISDFGHHLETLLEQVREGRVPASPELVQVILRSVDHIKTLLRAEDGGGGEHRSDEKRLLQEIEYLSERASVPNERRVVAAEPVEKIIGREDVGNALAGDSTVRVPCHRLDRLLTLVGELVTNQSRLAQSAADGETRELANSVEVLERLVAELRDNVLSIRMLPIGTLLGRFRRLVYDLSLELHKETELITEGAGTELDKRLLDRLGEPLVHLLRNAIDHGIETPHERVRKGKAAHGVIRLSAIQKGSDVILSIEDDGRGIDKAAVRAKAVEKHLIAADIELGDQETVNLILLPGFSTAKEVTNISGRGVGMDVVKKQIDSLRGLLKVDSEEGKGCRVSLTLPLTLAIIDGLVVEVGSAHFIVPMSAITENVEVPSAERARSSARNVLAIRDEPVPYIDLRAAFGIDGDTPPLERVVVVRHTEERVGLLVDRILGEHQTVIQSLGPIFQHIEVVSGASILGDGSVALILDIPAVVRYASRATDREREKVR